jgi:hypothetical protein
MEWSLYKAHFNLWVYAYVVHKSKKKKKKAELAVADISLFQERARCRIDGKR